MKLLLVFFDQMPNMAMLVEVKMIGFLLHVFKAVQRMSAGGGTTTGGFADNLRRGLSLHAASEPLGLV